MLSKRKEREKRDVVGVWSSELSYVLHVTQLQMMKETYTHLNVLINYSRASSKVPIMHRKVPELVVLLSDDSSSSVSRTGQVEEEWNKNGNIRFTFCRNNRRGASSSFQLYCYTFRIM